MKNEMKYSHWNEKNKTFCVHLLQCCTLLLIAGRVRHSVARLSDSRQRSFVWNYFSKDPERQMATCDLCKKVLATTGGNTSGAKKHLNKAHSIFEDTPLNELNPLFSVKTDYSSTN